MVSPLFLALVFFTVGVLSSYAPVRAVCPSGSLLRAASGLSGDEEKYRVARKAVADAHLKAWLMKTNSEFGVAELPTVALTTSGGGYRSLLLGAGVIQGLDGRDSDVSTSGLFQGLTYQAGLSGGSWLLSSFAGNNYPKISWLRDNLWEQAFQDSLLGPEHILAPAVYLEVVDDLLKKEAAGFQTTLTDPWGRLLSYQLLEGPDGGVDTTLSSIIGFSNFSSHAVPFPVITSLGVKTWLGDCFPGPNATTYEFTPFEFGSWDSDVSAFMQIHYLGTSMKSGKPAKALCTENYDNLGYILGTSSNLFNQLCLSVPEQSNPAKDLITTVEQILAHVHDIASSDGYAAYPNPFYESVSSTATTNVANNITAQETLYLVDGGEALQNNPIFPFLQPARNISVIIVNDNSADTSNNFPNGSEILTTYVQSFNHNLTRMPYIPSVDTFISEGLNQRATFFGCNDSSEVTIVYLPNYNFTFASNVPTLQLEYSKTETAAMIANGVEIASQGGKECWGTCLGCAIMMKTGQALPRKCTACFEEYCYYGS